MGLQPSNSHITVVESRQHVEHHVICVSFIKILLEYKSSPSLSAFTFFIFFLLLYFVSGSVKREHVSFPGQVSLPF